jgi:hypothetical protein
MEGGPRDKKMPGAHLVGAARQHGNTIVKKVRNTPSITYGNKMFK